MSEAFIVTFEVDVEGAEGGWNTQPILDAVKLVLAGNANALRNLTVERKSARLAGSEAPR